MSQSPFHKELLEELHAFATGAGEDWLDDAWAAGMYLLNMCGNSVLTSLWPAL